MINGNSIKQKKWITETINICRETDKFRNNYTLKKRKLFRNVQGNGVTTINFEYASKFLNSMTIIKILRKIYFFLNKLSLHKFKKIRNNRKKFTDGILNSKLIMFSLNISNNFLLAYYQFKYDLNFREKKQLHYLQLIKTNLYNFFFFTLNIQVNNTMYSNTSFFINSIFINFFDSLVNALFITRIFKIKTILLNNIKFFTKIQFFDKFNKIDRNFSLDDALYFLIKKNLFTIKNLTNDVNQKTVNIHSFEKLFFFLKTNFFLKLFTMRNSNNFNNFDTKIKLKKEHEKESLLITKFPHFLHQMIFNFLRKPENSYLKFLPKFFIFSAENYPSSSSFGIELYRKSQLFILKKF